MSIYFAPMEGITDSVYRRAHHACFSGVDKYFIPFISPTIHLVLSGREKTSVSPEENAGLPCIPQVLTKNTDHFLWAARTLADLGYEEVNLNLGCPSGTVTAKGKGAGFLRDRNALRAFLDDTFSRTPISISIKTRIGYESPEEWEALVDILSIYPASEIIIHPRTRQEFYSGTPHKEAYSLAVERLKQPLVYNGNLFSMQDCRDILANFPGTHALMLGRGLVANPALAQALTGGAPLTNATFIRFHDMLYDGYSQRFSKAIVMGKMREITKYMATCFVDYEKPWKAIRKAQNETTYLAATRTLFTECALAEEPVFIPFS